MAWSVKYKNSKGTFDIGKMIDDFADKCAERVSDVLDALTMACLYTVKECREQPSLDASHRHEPHQPNYIDDTGILRGSIGYMIYDHGQLYRQDFSGKGSAEGLVAAQTAASKFPNDIVAVVVAGAYYALMVESRGYNVITKQCGDLGEKFNKYLKIVFNS